MAVILLATSAQAQILTSADPLTPTVDDSPTGLDGYFFIGTAVHTDPAYATITRDGPYTATSPDFSSISVNGGAAFQTGETYAIQAGAVDMATITFSAAESVTVGILTDNGNNAAYGTVFTLDLFDPSSATPLVPVSTVTLNTAGATDITTSTNDFFYATATNVAANDYIVIYGTSPSTVPVLGGVTLAASAVVPEPADLGYLALGAGFLFFFLRKRLAK